jgi:putative nucleotidyltransferase with HDIG domain
MAFIFGRKSRGGWSGKLVARPPRWRGWGMAGNGLLLLALWLSGVVFIHLGGPQRYAGMAEGQRAPATVVAAVDFDCVNLAATELLRRQASETVVPVFAIQMGALQAAGRTLDKLADRAIKLRQAAETAPPKPAKDSPPPDAGGESKALESDLAVAADLLGISVSGEALADLFLPGQEMEVLSALKEILSDVWMKGILSEVERENGFQGLSQNPAVDILESSEKGVPAFRTVTLADLPTVEMAVDAYAAAVQQRLASMGVAAAEKTIEELVRPALRPNLEYDERATEERRTAVRRDIEPVAMTVRAGTTLVEERTTVTAQTVETINAYDRRMAQLESPYDRRMKQLGDSTLMLVVLVVCVGWLRSTRSEVTSRSRRKWMLVLLALLALAIEALYHFLAVDLNWIPPWLAPFAMPITLATLLAMLMLGPSAGLAMGLWSSLTASLIFDRSFETLLLGLGGSVVAVLLLRNVRKRSQVMRAGLAVGLVEGLMALALAAMYQHLPHTFLMQVAVGLSSGILAAILATLLLPLAEWLFQQTTAISLLELTDLSHPLLQRLALEAPGTYHHSLMTAAIGQAAANRIGADGLQVSVCAYFHDIGKLAKPEFFTENQRSGENPHDHLAPSMSALVIQSHVKEGLTLAKRYKLPRLVCDGIRSHHGTTLTSYFYQVAKRALKDAGLAEDAGLEHSYRYDGPKPTTREMAVLMLADTVEAASRSLEKAMPNRIAEMVETLMRDKLLDGQLDHCPLTLRDLHEIQASFVFSLTNILHGRNPYPREDPLAQPAKSAGPAPRGVPEADPDAGGPGSPG